MKTKTEILEFLQSNPVFRISVYPMPKGKALAWTMESNFEPKQYIKI
jgi:hypothetical protein